MRSADADFTDRAAPPGFCFTESENLTPSSSTSCAFSTTATCRPFASSNVLPESRMPWIIFCFSVTPGWTHPGFTTKPLAVSLNLQFRTMMLCTSNTMPQPNSGLMFIPGPVTCVTSTFSTSMLAQCTWMPMPRRLRNEESFTIAPTVPGMWMILSGLTSPALPTHELCRIHSFTSFLGPFPSDCTEIESAPSGLVRRPLAPLRSTPLTTPVTPST